MNQLRIRPDGKTRQGPKWLGQDLQSLHHTNLRTLLSAIWEFNPISRFDLSEATGLAPSSVTRLLQELIEMGLVKEIGKGESSGGRQPILVVPNSEAGLVISLDLSGPHLRGGLFDAANQLISVIDHPLAGLGPEAIQNQVLDMIRNLSSDSAVKNKSLLGIGVSLPGVVNRETGAVHYATNLRLYNFPLRQILTEEFGLPVYIEHDASVAALAERSFGAGKGLDYLAYVLVSTGIGVGLIIDGRIYRGETGSPAELGHVIVEPGGALCVCGKRGCLEAMAAAPSILMSARSLISRGQADVLANLCGGIPDRLTMEMVAQAAQHGDSIAADIMARSADHVAFGLNALVALFDIHHVIVGGEIAEAGEVFLASLRQSFENYSRGAEKIEIIPAGLQQNTFLRGISMLTLQEVLWQQIQNTRST